MKASHTLAATSGLLISTIIACPAHAESRKLLDGLRGALEPAGLSVEAEYTGEFVAVNQGDAKDQSFYLDNANISVNWDLEKAFGWSGSSFYMNVLSNSGERPNDAVGTLDGVSNIEVADGRWKIFEFAFEQKLGDKASVSFGYIDLNGHFYATESSGLLMGPPYGIGTELAVTGSNGPSIFPSSAPAIVLNLTPTEDSYAKLGVFGANSHNWGDPGSNRNFNDGVLTIAEAGLTKSGLIALGGWRYSNKVSAYDPLGTNPKSINPWGIYALLEKPLIASETGRSVTGFFRAGYSDGETTDFTGSVTTGILVDRILGGRPNSQFSLGLRQAYVSDQFKDNTRLAGLTPLSSETGVELTLADQLNSSVTLHGSVQYVPNPGAIRAANDALVSSVRLSVAF
jgi:porin